MARYLKDRRNGELYGWNHEMAKLGYMKEVDSEDDDFDDGKPDPTYVDPETGVAIGAVSDDPDEAVRFALERAATVGQDDLTTEVGSVEELSVEPDEEVEDDEEEVVEEEVVEEVEPEPEPAPAKRRRK